MKNGKIIVFIVCFSNRNNKLYYICINKDINRKNMLTKHRKSFNFFFFK